MRMLALKIAVMASYPTLILDCVKECAILCAGNWGWVDMHLKKKHLREEEEDFTDEEKADFSCRKECNERNLTETVTDVRTAIKHLPKRYFKDMATNTGICLENTHSGLKTIVGRIKKVKRKRDNARKKSQRSYTLLIAIGVAVGVAAIAGIAYFVVSSLLSCYESAPVQESKANPQT